MHYRSLYVYLNFPPKLVASTFKKEQTSIVQEQGEMKEGKSENVAESIIKIEVTKSEAKFEANDGPEKVSSDFFAKPTVKPGLKCEPAVDSNQSITTICKPNSAMFISLTRDIIFPSDIAGPLSLKLESVKDKNGFESIDIVILFSKELSPVLNGQQIGQTQQQRSKSMEMVSKGGSGGEMGGACAIRIKPDDLYFIGYTPKTSVMLSCKKLGCKLVFLDPEGVETFKRVYIDGFLMERTEFSGFFVVSEYAQQELAQMRTRINEVFPKHARVVPLLAKLAPVQSPIFYQHRSQKFEHYVFEATLCAAREMAILLASRMLDIQTWIKQQKGDKEKFKEVLNDLKKVSSIVDYKIQGLLRTDDPELKIVLQFDWDKPGKGQGLSGLPAAAAYKSKYNQWFRPKASGPTAGTGGGGGPSKANLASSMEMIVKDVNLTVNLEPLSNCTGSPWVDHKIIIHPKDVLLWKETRKPANASYGLTEHYTLTVYRIYKREYYHIRHSNLEGHQALMAKFVDWLTKKSNQEVVQGCASDLESMRLINFNFESTDSNLNLTWSQLHQAMVSLWGPEARLSFGYLKEIRSTPGRWDDLQKVVRDDMASFLVKWFGKAVSILSTSQESFNPSSNDKSQQLYAIYEELSKASLDSVPKGAGAIGKDLALIRAKCIASYIHYENPE